MTTRCYPADREFESVAERVVWEALRDQLPDEAALLANLRMTDRG